MNIGFDAKRAYHNTTGLGYYSRTIIGLLKNNFPQHEYFLFNPKSSHKFHFEGKNLHEIQPSSFLGRTFSSAWRSSWVKNDLKRLKIDIYHGLSHEIPVGIDKTGIRSVVTIHDLIHERYPEQYNPIDVRIYHKKFLYACQHADRVIAISKQTKEDIIRFYKIPAEKIEICYQSCDPAFGKTVAAEEKERIRKKYGLPGEFFLYVGSIIDRKNLLNIAKAFFLLRDELKIPLVVIGNGGKYKQKVKDYILQHGLEDRFLFLSEKPCAKNDPEFRLPEAFAAIYQSAIAMIYPSFFEGFGLPVSEALWSRLPVITSNQSCLPEVGGDAAYYVDPSQSEQIAEAIKKIYHDSSLADSMKQKGWVHANLSTPEIYVKNMMDIYLRTMQRGR
jgi:glycosyltransferase involved in cell wall biosynthesis